MTPADTGSRLDAVLGSAPELFAYQRWLDDETTHRDGPRDYLFAEARPRFEPRKDDVVAALPGLAVRVEDGTTLLASDVPAVRLPLPGVARPLAERVLAAIDGRRCLLEIRLQAGVEQRELASILRTAFGVVLFAPEAVTSLESRLSGVEIVRFPSAPYAIERPYWENMIAVRARVLARHPTGTDDLVHLLRELHVIALMGESLSSFYRPPSPAADDLVGPGNFYTDAPRTIETERGTLYLDGPRVNVSFVGGEAYHRALYASVDDGEAGAPARQFIEAGLDWGRVVTARSERETEPKPWFLPPRPLTIEHFDSLYAEIERAFGKGDVGAMARLHQKLVRLHPFRCANQSIAMNLVNAALTRTHGAGMPHFILDQLALRLRKEAYEQVFRRAVRAFAVEETDAKARFAVLADRMKMALRFVREPGGADEAGARFALVADPA
jgi:hypothetical protein